MGERTNGVLKRRGLLAGAAALAGAGLAKLTGPGQAAAGHDTTTAPTATNVMHLGVINDGGNAADNETTTSLGARTVLLATGGGVFRARNLTASGTNNSNAIEGVANAFGVIGRQTGSLLNHSTFGLASGVAGVSETGGSGVVGRSTTGAGVRGLSNEGQGVLGMARTTGIDSTSGTNQKAGVAGVGVGSVGVLAISDTQTGVFGQSTSGVGTIGISTNAAGMYGFSANGVGAFGTSPTSVGLFGQASQNAGVFGDSPVNGVWGRTESGLGVKGEATGGGIGVYGRAGAGGWAGYFFGNLYVTGQIYRAGTPLGPSATEATSAQTVESFGEAQLVNGAATVPLDAETAEAIGGGAYQVVLTEYGNIGGLYVHRRGARDFEVRSRGAAAGSFGYRVVATHAAPARRGATAEAAPSIAIPKDLPVPKVPELPKVELSRPEGGPERQGRPDAR